MTNGEAPRIRTRKKCGWCSQPAETVCDSEVALAEGEVGPAEGEPNYCNAPMCDKHTVSVDQGDGTEKDFCPDHKPGPKAVNIKKGETAMEWNENQVQTPGLGIGESSGKVDMGLRPTSLLNRLYARRSEYQQMIRRINNSIEVLEKNQALVEIVEIVLLSEQKADRPIF